MSSCGSSPAAPVGAVGSVVLENVRAVTTSHPCDEPTSVWLAGGRVREIAREIAADADAERTDGTGRRLLPGGVDLQRKIYPIVCMCNEAGIEDVAEEEIAACYQALMQRREEAR